MKVKVTQSCPTLCNPMDYTVHRILQARILEWVVFPFSMGSSQSRNRTRVSCIAGNSLPVDPHRKPKKKMKQLSHAQLFVTLWTVACQASPSMGFSLQKYWSGLLFSLPGDLLDTGIEPESPALADRFFTTETPGKPF